MTPQSAATLLASAFSAQGSTTVPPRIRQEYHKLEEHGGFHPVTLTHHTDVGWCVVAQGDKGLEVFFCQSSFGLETMLAREELTREETFKEAVAAVILTGKHPSGVRIRTHLGKLRYPTDGNLGGDETRWRRELLLGLGWTRGPNMRARWKPPQGG